MAGDVPCSSVLGMMGLPLTAIHAFNLLTFYMYMVKHKIDCLLALKLHILAYFLFVFILTLNDLECR